MENTSFDCLAVTAVKITPYTGEKANIKANASVILNDQLKMTDLRVMEGENGLFVGYPHKGEGDDYQSIVFPIVRQLREHIENCVLERYQCWLECCWLATFKSSYKRNAFDPDTTLQFAIFGETYEVAKDNATDKLADMVQNLKAWELVSLEKQY